MSDLRNRLIRLAAANPGLRADLLPLLREDADPASVDQNKPESYYGLPPKGKQAFVGRTAMDFPSEEALDARAAMQDTKRKKMRLAVGPIASAAEFEQLAPGDRITVNGKPAVVINYDSFGAELSYAWEGTSTIRDIDARYAWAYEPGEIPETNVTFVGPGKPIKAPRRAPRRQTSRSYYD